MKALVSSLVGHFGGPEGRLEAVGDRLGSLEGYLRDLEGHLGAKKAAKGQNHDFALVFGCFLSELGDNWLGLGANWRVWKAILGGVGGHLGGPEGHVGRSVGPFWGL